MTTIERNAQDLESDLQWLGQIIESRINWFFANSNNSIDFSLADPPGLKPESSLFANFVLHYNLTIEERLVLVLGLAPYFKPQLLDPFFARNEKYERGCTEFGGIKGMNHGGFIPTAETAFFLLAGNDLAGKFSIHRLFESDHFFAKHGILKLDPAPDGEPFQCGPIRVAFDLLDLFSTGMVRKPVFSVNFPAHLIETELEWKDLVLDEFTLKQVREIQLWIEHEDTLMNKWGLRKKIRPGFRCLFYGASGTGKTMTASLIGKQTGRDVYRIDLSTVVSKYVGETEKNLSRIFDQAENKNWILFFDEADALLGKRTKIDDAHDKYANQEVSYLLQRLEIFNGVVILASNMKGNLDSAFTRRFESVIFFPIPQKNERFKLWQNGFFFFCALDEQLNLNDISEKYELTGGSTMNVIRFCSLKALERNSNTILLKDVEEGIKRELYKEGKTA